MRTEVVGNTISLRENTETETFITDVENRYYKANLSDVQKHHPSKNHLMHQYKRQFKVNYREVTNRWFKVGR